MIIITNKVRQVYTSKYAVSKNSETSCILVSRITNITEGVINVLNFINT